MGNDIRESRDDLLFRREIGTLLEFEVTESTGESQIAVDSAKVDETSSRTYPCLLAYEQVRTFSFHEVTEDIPSFCGL